jgi:RNA polymerase sporulation-specific sigma factor
MNEKLLSHEETIDLIRLSQKGDGKAQEKLAQKNIALVKSIVKKYLNRGLEYDDLYQLGSLGLIKAIKNYDEKFEVRFSTYAVPMIAGEIKRFLRDDGIIKVSRSLKETAGLVLRTKEHLKEILGREPKIGEISEKIDIPREEIVEAMEASRMPISIFEPVYDDGENKTMIVDRIKGDDEKAIFDRLLLKELIGNLEARDRQVVFLRYFKDKTQAEIAEIMGVSQVQISRMITKIIEKLKDEILE